MLETHMKLYVTKPNFSDNFFASKIKKLGQNWIKKAFIEFTEKFDHKFLLNLFYDENLYYVLCSYTYIVLYSRTNPIFGKKIFFPEIWSKISSANQIARFFNQPYLQNKSVKLPDFSILTKFT